MVALKRCVGLLEAVLDLVKQFHRNNLLDFHSTGIYWTRLSTKTSI